jgi:hypothetical protein
MKFEVGQTVQIKAQGKEVLITSYGHGPKEDQYEVVDLMGFQAYKTKAELAELTEKELKERQERRGW